MHERQRRRWKMQGCAWKIESIDLIHFCDNIELDG